MSLSRNRTRLCPCCLCRNSGDLLNPNVIRRHVKHYGVFDTDDSELPSCSLEMETEPEIEIVHDFQIDASDHGGSPTLEHSIPMEVNDEIKTNDPITSSENEDELSDYEEDNDLVPVSDESDITDEHDIVEESDDEVLGNLDEKNCHDFNFNFDKTAYSSGLATQVLSGSSDGMTVLQWLALNFYNFTCHPGTSKTAFSANLRIQTVMQPRDSDVLPSNYKEARRMIEPYLVKKIVFSTCENDCVIFRDSSKYNYKDLSSCPVCLTERYYNINAKRAIAKRKFSYIPVGPRLARIFGNANLAQIVQSHPGSEIKILEKGMEMWDVHDSLSWRQLYSQSGYFKGNKMGFSFALELDGVNPYHNIGVIYSMTPIMLTLLNFPRHIRNLFGNIFLVGIIPGNKRSEASNLDPYIEILVDELIFLSGCTAYSEYDKAPVKVKVKLLMYILDYPALSKIFRQLGSGALAGCHWCHIRGIHCKHLDKVIYLSNRSYLKLDDPLRQDTSNFYHKCEVKVRQPELRVVESESKYREAYDSAKNKSQAATIATATGCKGKYILSDLPEHDRLNQCQPDACHTLKDVMQNIVHLITAKNIDINKIISAENAFDRFSHMPEATSRSVNQTNKPTSVKKRKTAKKRLPRNISNVNVAHREECEKQAFDHLHDSTSVLQPSSQKSGINSIPFILSKDELKLADDRAENIRIPLGFGLKPARFIGKTGSLKSHDWKQLASQGILKFCLKGTLGEHQRCTLFKLLDCFEVLCAESQSLDRLEKLEERLNHTLALLERDFPLTLQNITTRILHHIIDGIKRFGPVYGTWMYVFERFNSWICKRAINMRYPESTAIETYLVYDWCNFMLMSGRLTSYHHLIIPGEPQQFLDEENEIGAMSVCKNLPLIGNSHSVTLKPQVVSSIHRLSTVDKCQQCVIEKYYYHQEVHSITKRTLTYTCVQKEKVSNKTISSFVSCEFKRGSKNAKVMSGKFVAFGQIQYFLVHSNSTCKTYIAKLGLFDAAQYDEETGLWFAKHNSVNRYTCVLVSELSPPLVTAIENDCIWFCNSGKQPFYGQCYM